MKLKKIFVSLAVLAVLGGAATFSCVRADKSFREAKADPDNLLTVEQLRVIQISHSKSNNSESFSYRFSASYAGMTNYWKQAYIAVDDDSFDESEQTNHASEEDIPHYAGLIVQFDGRGSANTDGERDDRSLAVIPNGIKVGSKYIVNSTKIKSGVDTKESYYDIYGVFIPSTVTTIESGAFAHAHEFPGVKFYCECEADAKPEGWADGWTSAADEDIVYGYKPIENLDSFTHTFYNSRNIPSGTDEEVYNRVVSDVLLRGLQIQTDIPTGYNFALNFKGTVQYNTYNPATEQTEQKTDEFDQVLVVNYDIIKNGNRRAGTPFEIPAEQTANSGAFYGATFGVSAGDISKDISFNIDIEEGENIDNESIIFTNIHYMKYAGVKNNSGVIEPDLSTPLVPDNEAGSYSAKALSAAQTVQLEDITSFSDTEFVSYSNYTQVNFKISNKAKSAYEKYDSKVYNEYKSRINRGEYYLRFRIVEIYNTKLSFKYQGSNEFHDLKLPTPIQYDYVILGDAPEGNKISFLFANEDVGPGFSADKVEVLKIKKLCFKIEIVKRNADTSNAEKDCRFIFGLVEVYNTDKVAKASVVNLITIFIIVMAAYVALFAGVTVFLFFYIKNKYKNDEFKRLKPKQFFITTGKNFVGYLLVTLAATFIVFRTALLDSKVVMYNPLDVFVIAFTIAGGIFIGFTIKNLVVGIKRNIENNKKKKLHLDKDVVEDGTK